MGFSSRLVGWDVSCLPGVGVVGEGCAVCGGGSTGSECRAYGIRALASCKLHAQGWHASCLVWLCQPRLAGRISSIKAGVLWKALQTLLRPPALCSDAQDCMLLPPPPFHLQTLLLLGFHSRAGGSVAFERLWEMGEVVCGANGWSRAQAGTQEEMLCCLFKPSPGQSDAPGLPMPGGLAAVSDLPLPSRDNETRPRGAESPASVRRGELRSGPCSVLSLQKTRGEERSKQKDHSK